MKKNIAFIACLLLSSLLKGQEKYTVAAYYFPNWHVDPNNEKANGKGWTEWETLKKARPRFEGHQQPKVPMWGYEDEADPRVMAKKIDAAADNGVNTYFFDWYYTNEGPRLQRCLEEGFLKAANKSRMKFAIMWANHWTVTPANFDSVMDICINRYFKDPSYFKVDGCPYFCIYQLYTFIESFGSVDKARAAIATFRAKTKAAGFKDLHLNAMQWGLHMPDSMPVRKANELIDLFTINSVDTYVWIHTTDMPDFPVTTYDYMMKKAPAYWDSAYKAFKVPYHPNVSMGWDASPRTDQSKPMVKGEYPNYPILTGNTPEKFKQSLREAKHFLDHHPACHNILTVNSWNEWTEGSYLEPDTLHKMAYLHGIREVFGADPGPARKKDYEVAVYYFPNYHPDSINARWHGKGWTEWEVVKAARPRFPGHEQPKIPSWGYFNEADPAWASQEIDLAADNGIDVFIYDWYWYSNTGQYLQEGLEKGFLQSPNRNRLKFALMWANHDWLNIQPATFDNHRIKLTDGAVSMPLWDTISTYIVDHYFRQPNYWKIDGKPYFSIYEIVTFINGLGGIRNAKAAIHLLDEKARKAGFPGIHFNVMSWMVNDTLVKTITGPNPPANAEEMLAQLQAQSVSTYAYIHHFNTAAAGFPSAPYEKALSENEQYWHRFIRENPDVLYTPNVSMGWDASPRCMQTDRFEQRDYPWTPVLTGNTPEAFGKALQDAKAFLDQYAPKHKIIVLNSWNEWTEGSYLLPEKKYGDAYLKAVKAVFGN